MLAHALGYSTVLGQPGKGLLTHLCVNLLTDAIFEINIKKVHHPKKDSLLDHS